MRTEDRPGRRAALLGSVLFLVLGATLVSPQDASALAVSEFGVGTGVEDRELRGRGDRFAEGTQVWFWTRVRGGEPGQRIRHVWLREGQGDDEGISIGLTLGGAHWRTWSVKTMHPGSAGRWTVEARDDDGRVLARAEFTCAPAGPAAENP